MRHRCRCRKGLGLFVAGILLLSGCAGDEDITSHGEEQRRQDVAREEKEKQEDDVRPGNIAGDEADEPEIPEDIEDWKRAYVEYMYTGLEQGDVYTCSLIYVDADDIPELVLDTGGEAGGCQILTYHGGVLDVLQTSRLYFDYIERGNLLCNSDGHMGYYYDWVYTIEDGEWNFVTGGEWYEKEDVEIEEDGVLLYDYIWETRLVTEEEYDSRLREVYDKESAVRPEKYEIPLEMISRLTTGEMRSAGHRYELIVDDVTWTEAHERCLAHGGYLAVITSEEEFAAIEAQMIREEKTRVTFWVGARNPKEDGAWGYRWREQGQLWDEYDMIFYWNVYAPFWLDGEPSYEGQTESGETVKEDCVDLFYRSSEGRCYLNDVPDDILAAAPSYAGRIGYICEYDE